MSRTRRAKGAGGPIARAALLAWPGLFLLLSADVLVRVFGVRGRLESGTDAAALMAIEGCRTVALLLALLLVAVVVLRPRARAGTLFAVLIAFTAVGYAKAFAFAGYPGYAQEWLARQLIGAGTPLPLLDLVFGSPEWSLWIAMGALLRLSVTWPHPLDPARIAGSGTTDRRGMMRSVALAGADIGAGFRTLSAATVSRGLLGSSWFWPAVVVAGVLHSRADVAGLRVVFMAGLMIGTAIAITNLRAAFGSATRRQRSRILWGATAATTAVATFLVSSTLSLGGDSGSVVIGVATGSLAPIVVLVTLMPLIRRTPPPAAVWLRRAILVGSGVLTGALAYLLSLMALPGTAPTGIGVREFVALATSVVLVGLSVPRLREIADRITPPLAG